MAEPIGIASGILTLATFAFKSTVSLYETVQSLQNNHRYIRQLKEELEALKTVTQSLHKLASTGGVQLEGLDGLRLSLLHCGEVCRDFEKVIAECTKPSSDSKSSLRDWAKLQYKGNDIVGFRDLIANYKSTINIAIADVNLRTVAATANAIQEFKKKIENTNTDLRNYLEDLNEKFEGLRVQETNATRDVGAADREWITERIKECMAVCARASEHVAEVRVNDFEDITSAGDAHMVIVSTFGDLISAKRVSAGSGATMLLGQMSDATLQQLIQSRTSRLGELGSVQEQGDGDYNV